jgi:hypothetical protein
MNLGELIDALERADSKSSVSFDFCRCMPTAFGSWRGIYSELALGWVGQYDATSCNSVGDLLSAARLADGATFTGYKGGQFVMSRETQIWIDNYGEYTSTRLAGVADSGSHVTLITSHDEDK